MLAINSCSIKVLSSQHREPFSDAWKQSRRRLEVGALQSAMRVFAQCYFIASIETSGLSWKLSGPSPPNERFTSLSKSRGPGSAREIFSSSSYNALQCTTTTYAEFAPQEPARLLVVFPTCSFQWMRPFDDYRCRPDRLLHFVYGENVWTGRVEIQEWINPFIWGIFRGLRELWLKIVAKYSMRASFSSLLRRLRQSIPTSHSADSVAL